jgi:hypothetical protein
MDIFKLKVGAFIFILLVTINISLVASIAIIPLFVIEEDMMRVNTGNEETISLVRFFDVQSQVLLEEIEGCHTSKCAFNIEHIIPQEYLIRVTTNQGSVFSQEIIIE